MQLKASAATCLSRQSSRCHTHLPLPARPQLLPHSSAWQLELGAGRQRWTPLCLAVAEGQEAIAARLLQHAQQRLQGAALNEYLDEACEGSAALFRWVEGRHVKFQQTCVGTVLALYRHVWPPTWL